MRLIHFFFEEEDLFPASFAPWKFNVNFFFRLSSIWILLLCHFDSTAISQNDNHFQFLWRKQMANVTECNSILFEASFCSRKTEKHISFLCCRRRCCCCCLISCLQNTAAFAFIFRFTIEPRPFLILNANKRCILFSMFTIWF